MRIDETGDGWVSLSDIKRCMTDERVREHFDAQNITFEDTEMFFRMLATMPNSHDGKVDIHTFAMGCTRLRGVASSLQLHTLAYEVKLMHRNQGLLYKFCKDEFKTLRGPPKHIDSYNNAPAEALTGMPNRFEGKLEEMAKRMNWVESGFAGSERTRD